MAMQDPDSRLIVLHLISRSRDSDSIALQEQITFPLDKQNNTNQLKIKSIKSPYFWTIQLDAGQFINTTQWPCL